MGADFSKCQGLFRFSFTNSPGTQSRRIQNAANEFQESPSSKQKRPHTTQPAALPVKNAEAGSVMEN
jgi:hypothetical protein